MKILSPLILLAAIAGTTNAICCYTGVCGHKMDASPVPLELRWYDSEVYAPEDAVNVYKRGELGPRGIAPRGCCCFAVSASQCSRVCGVSNAYNFHVTSLN